MPRRGISFWCAACDGRDSVKRVSRKLLYLAEVGRVKALDPSELEAVLAPWSGWWTTFCEGEVYRHVVLCKHCASSSAKRVCEQPPGRCANIAIGSRYCAQHRTAKARYFRESLPLSGWDLPDPHRPR